MITPFAILAGFAVALAMLAAYSAWRVRRLERAERHLSQLVEERTRELRERQAELEVANAALQEMATIDALTGLSNRRRLDVYLQQEWQRARRARQPLSLLLVDVDRFKSFNDTYGHQAGDETLRKLADVLRSAAHRVSDLAARYGGEEFAVVLPNTERAGALKVAHAIGTGLEALAIPHVDVPTGVVTVSVGAATRVAGGYDTVTELIGAADRALYAAKRAGRNRVATDESV